MDMGGTLEAHNVVKWRKIVYGNQRQKGQHTYN